MPSSYDALLVRVQRMDAIKQTLYMLEWDQHTYMPPGGTEARSQEISALSALRHELLTAPETGKLLAQAEADAKAQDAPERAVLREVRWDFDRATRVPTSLVEAQAKEASVAFPAWVDAKRTSDFAKFRPHLEKLVQLRRDYAAAVDPDAPAYAVLFNDYEPTIQLEDARRILAALREGLRPLISRAPESQPQPSPFGGTWPADKQLDLCKRLVGMLGYDFEHGRLDVSPHPFTSGNQYDSRITTRFEEANPTSGLLAAIHEAGHALYQLGLPKEHFGSPLGDARDLVVHESQSRLWENHVGRSLPFWEKALPVFHDVFGAAMPRASAEQCWRAVNHVQPSLIRVYADELTYHMHVALRFEIEEALVSGELAVREVPARWNELMQKYLGITPPDDARGCLQDMHWSGGTFGYFPTYSLGSILSAQLYASYQRGAAGGGRRAVDATDYAALRAWLVENVHKHGKRYTTPELVRRATGAPLSPDAFLAYAKDKYERLWR